MGNRPNSDEIALLRDIDKHDLLVRIQTPTLKGIINKGWVKIGTDHGVNFYYLTPAGRAALEEGNNASTNNSSAG